MSSIVFFVVVIPILSSVLLLLNFIFAPHNPYKEKRTPFECGYHSFLAQNRTQFTISFFIFGLLFLLFDLEIVMIYPLSVSGYINEGYGFIVIILFVLILALGFIFELGKNALKIDSKQYSNLLMSIPLKSHSFVNSSLQSSIFSSIFIKVLEFIVEKTKSRILASVLTWLKLHMSRTVSTYVKQVFKDTSVNFIQLIYHWGIINMLNFIAMFMYLVMCDLRKNIIGGMMLLFILCFSIESNVFVTHFLIKLCVLGLLLYIHNNYIITYYYRNTTNVLGYIFVIISLLLIACCLILIYWDLFYIFEYIMKQILNSVHGLILKTTGLGGEESSSGQKSKGKGKGRGDPEPDPDPYDPPIYGPPRRKKGYDTEQQLDNFEKQREDINVQIQVFELLEIKERLQQQTTDVERQLEQLDPLAGMDIENKDSWELMQLRDKFNSRKTAQKRKLEDVENPSFDTAGVAEEQERCRIKRDLLSRAVKRAKKEEKKEDEQKRKENE